MPSMDNTSPSRRQLLINGRRVRVSDLIEADLLRPGTQLFYQRRLYEEPYEATVTERGRLRLVDGREFATPSRAGAVVSNQDAVAGWSAWRVGVDGPSLHDLRQRLLRMAAEEPADPTEELPVAEATAARHRFEMLNEFQKKAEVGEPETLTVRQLLALWGFEDRDRAATIQIDADLANHGLATAPDFRAVSLDRTVRMVLTSQVESVAAASAPMAPADVDTVEVTVDEESSVDIGLTLGNLLPEDATLAYVSPTASYDEAITAMELNDYSQVAVLANPFTLHGAVSWKSITQARNTNPDAPFSEAIDRDVKVFDYNKRLLDVLPTLQQDEFIFVKDYDRKISGIVTAADVVRKYDDTATPFFLIGEIDQELRQLIQGAFDEETARQACVAANLSFKSFDHMTMGQYQAVLANEDCWEQLGWKLHRKSFVARLDQIRQVRNKVMHFNPDPVKALDVAKLRHFLDLIRRYNR